MTAPFTLKDAAEIAYAGLPGVRVVANDGGSAVIMDATSPEGRAAVSDRLRRMGSQVPRASREERRAQMAALCGEAFCLRMEAGRPGYPWELV